MSDPHALQSRADRLAVATGLSLALAACVAVGACSDEDKPTSTQKVQYITEQPSAPPKPGIIVISRPSLRLFDVQQNDMGFSMSIYNKGRTAISYWEVTCLGHDAKGDVVHADMSNGLSLDPGAYDSVRDMMGFNRPDIVSTTCAPSKVEYGQ